MSDAIKNAELQILAFDPKTFIKVYTASKVHHAPFLLELRKSWPRIHWTSRWPVMAMSLTPEQKAGIPASHWLVDNEDDIISSEIVLGYAAKNDKMRCGLWEMGIATAHRKPIYLVDDHPDWSHWKHHPAVVMYGKSLKTTLEAISRLKNYKKGE